MRRFNWLLPGATARDRLIAAVGALVSIALVGWISSLATGGGAGATLLVAPMGASAVLLFVVPSSPLAQPWPIVGGSVISAIIGVAVAQLIPNLIVASGLAVGLAIAAMTVTRTLHPPGGAVALLAVIGGADITSAGFAFPFWPVGLNALLLTLLGLGFHRFSTARYPQRPPPAPASVYGTADRPPSLRVGVQSDDIDRAIADMGEAFDISHSDLARIIRRVERLSLERTHGQLICADIMSRDVIKVTAGTPIESARISILEQGVRTLPVVDDGNRVLGTVGLRELAKSGAIVDDVMSEPTTASPMDGIVNLVAPLSDGRRHAAVIVDNEGRLLGLVTQTDMVAALAKSPVVAG